MISNLYLNSPLFIPITLVFAKGFLAVVCIAKKYYFTLTTHPPPLHTEP